MAGSGVNRQNPDERRSSSGWCRRSTMDEIITKRSGSILRVELNRPAKRNAMTSSMYVTLADVFIYAAKDDRTRVVLWHGAGAWLPSLKAAAGLTHSWCTRAGTSCPPTSHKRAEVTTSVRRTIGRTRRLHRHDAAILCRAPKLGAAPDDRRTVARNETGCGWQVDDRPFHRAIHLDGDLTEEQRLRDVAPPIAA
jgi:hypothetical protein